MTELESLAKEYATKCHGAQLRKYTFLPYITHPESVANIVRSVDNTEEMLCASWLHDVVEDTYATYSDIFRLFGAKIADYVSCLTDVTTPSDGNRKFRKAIERRRISHSPDEVKTIKLADLIDNTSSIVEFDPEFAKVFLDEVSGLLVALHGGDQSLWDRANHVLFSSLRTLERGF